MRGVAGAMTEEGTAMTFTEEVDAEVEVIASDVLVAQKDEENLNSVGWLEPKELGLVKHN